MTESERDRVARVGLCSRCRHARAIRTATGSEFWLCERSQRDAHFAKYPRLPMRACQGFEGFEGFERLEPKAIELPVGQQPPLNRSGFLPTK